MCKTHEHLQKGQNKCTVAQKEFKHIDPLFLVLIFN